MKRVVDGRFTASDRTGAVIDVNPLNPARLTRRELLACGMSAIAVGCGGGTRTPTAPTPTDTPSTAPVSVTGQVIDVLTGGPVPDVVLQAGPDPVPVDAAGRFEVTLTPALVRLTVTAPGYVPRNTGLRVPGPHAVVSLIPVSFDLASFDVMCRTSWARGLPDLLSRWRQPFDLVLDRTVYRNDFGAPNQHVFLDDRISQGTEAFITSTLRSALPVLNGRQVPRFCFSPDFRLAVVLLPMRSVVTP